MELNAVQKRIEQIEKLEEENRIDKEMLMSELENEDTYLEAVEKYKEATNKKKQVKEEILARPANQEIVDKIKENTEEIKTLKEILTTELIAMYQTTKSEEFTDGSGAIRKFKVSVRLLPKSGRIIAQPE